MNTTKFASMGMAGILGALLVAGCSSPTQGVVGMAGPCLAPGSVAPDIVFCAPDGTQKRLHKERQAVAIVAFVNPCDTTCSQINPQLGYIADSDRDVRNLSVVQVAQPGTASLTAKGCYQTCDLGKTNTLLLCDANRIAWDAYANPVPGTVYLVDWNNKIIDVACVDNMSALRDRGVQLARQYRGTHGGDQSDWWFGGD